MTTEKARAELRVLEIRPIQSGHRGRRWAVRCAVERPLSAGFPGELRSLTLLLHSPSRTFATPVEDLPRYVFDVEFADTVEDPYAGELAVVGWRLSDPAADDPPRRGA